MGRISLFDQKVQKTGHFKLETTNSTLICNKKSGFLNLGKKSAPTNCHLPGVAAKVNNSPKYTPVYFGYAYDLANTHIGN